MLFVIYRYYNIIVSQIAGEKKNRHRIKWKVLVSPITNCYLYVQLPFTPKDENPWP